jgi:methyl-accepting chemotaxis protein
MNTELQPILAALNTLKQGDFTYRLPVEDNELKEVHQAFNELAASNQHFTSEIIQVATSIGTEGKLDSQIEINNAAGSWKEIFDSINDMSLQLKEQFRSIAQIMHVVSQGDLCEKIEVENAGEFQILTTNINTMITNLRSSIQEIAEVTTTVASSAEEFSAVSQEMTENATQTAEQATSASASAEQVSQNAIIVATAVEQMNASIREIAKNADEGAQVATNAVKTADETNTTITKLGNSSTEIGKVIKVITSIAQQTNLLALNATIEAARAGDAGRGFAVVAGEVKELARATAKATDDISQRIETIQTDTKSAIDAIAEISAVINQINDIQNTIASAVEEQTATTNEIARNVSEAAKGTTDIAKNISVVAVNAQNTTTGAANTSQAANELTQMAVDLQKIISKFEYS